MLVIVVLHIHNALHLYILVYTCKRYLYGAISVSGCQYWRPAPGFGAPSQGRHTTPSPAASRTGSGCRGSSRKVGTEHTACCASEGPAHVSSPS